VAKVIALLGFSFIGLLAGVLIAPLISPVGILY